IFLPVPPRQSLQSAQRIENHNHRPCRIKRRANQTVLRELFFFDQGRTSAVAERIGQKAMAVSLLAFQSNKQRAGSSAARVGTDAVNYERGRSATQFTTDFMRNTLQCRRDQVIAAPVRV